MDGTEDDVLWKNEDDPTSENEGSTTEESSVEGSTAGEGTDEDC